MKITDYKYIKTYKGVIKLLRQNIVSVKNNYFYPSFRYAIMLRCWQETPSERPSFEDLRKSFEGFQEEVSHYINLDFKEINILDH